MRNLAVKLAIVAARFKGYASPQLFLDRTPAEALEVLKRELPDMARQCLYFGFSDRAFLDVLDTEFDVDMERHLLVFRKPALDAESIRVASGIERTFSPEEETLLNSLVQWLFDVSRPLYRNQLTPAREADIREEYRLCFCLYGQKYSHETENRLFRLFSSRRAMTGFTHAMTVDALYKADAARELFGGDAAYFHAWLRKQMFRHMVTQAVEKYIFSYAA